MKITTKTTTAQVFSSKAPRAQQPGNAATCIMCFPTNLPPNDHFLRKPMVWTHNIWQKIINAKGNEKSIKDYFNLLPILETHIEELVGIRLLRAQDDSDTQQNTIKNLLQDYYVSLNVDKWETDRASSSPSVLQQMCAAAKKYRHFLATNYYFPLINTLEEEETSYRTMANEISGTTTSITPASTRKLNNNNYEVDVIDLDQLDDLLNEQRMQDDLTREEEDVEMSSTQIIEATQNPSRHAMIYVYRITIRRLHKQRAADTLKESFKKFFIALKHADSHAAIRPVYLSDANKIPAITAGTQVQQIDLVDITRYHQSWTPNQKWALTGNMVIESAIPLMN